MPAHGAVTMGERYGVRAVPVTLMSAKATVYQNSIPFAHGYSFSSLAITSMTLLSLSSPNPCSICRENVSAAT